ncbi:hypothetical protein MKW92_050666 [Papaver armeniacum]|nr:hypothetical protein MKW92_050666 [Papaver armeniacum]
MEGDEEAIVQIEQLMASDEYEQRVQEFADFSYFVCCICKGRTIDDDDDEELRARYSSRDDILKGLKDILRTIPRYNRKKSMEHLQLFDCIGLTRVLLLLFRSSIKENKEIAKECIRLFLIDPKTNSGFFLPRSIQNQCATIVLSFCEVFRIATNDEERRLYYSCRETLISILKSVAFSNRPAYFGIAMTSKLIGGLNKIFHETYMKLRRSLVSTYLSPSPLATTELSSLKRTFCEFVLFSLHIRSAIHEHLRVKGQSLPLDPNAFKKYPYLNDIYMFYVDFTSLLRKLDECLKCLDVAVRDAGGNLKFNIGWSYLLSILKELNSISKLYEDGEELLSGAFRAFPLQLDILFGTQRGVMIIYGFSSMTLQ